MQQVFYENTSRHTLASTCYKIQLRPVFILQNCLPINIICCVFGLPEETLIGPGECLPVQNITPGASNIVIRVSSGLMKGNIYN